MTAAVKAFGDWKTNAEMIADVAKLGYFDGRVMDPTWGEGNFWTVFKPRKLVRHDLYTLDHVDVTLPLPHRANSFDSIVIDLPYAFRGTATEDFDGKYGVDEYMSANAIMERMFSAMLQCAHVLKEEGYLLIKCQDQVVSGHVRWQTDELRDFGKQIQLRKVDRFDFTNGGREQPTGRTKKCPTCGHSEFPDFCGTCGGSGRVPTTQQHAGYRPSTLLVFQKPKARKR